MIGRGALGNPWMLYRTVQYLANGELPPEPTAGRENPYRDFAYGSIIALKGEHVAVKEMRKHMAWYLKGMTGAARVKDVIMEMLKRDEMVRAFE